MALTVEARAEGGWLVVVVDGELDLYTVPALRPLLSEALAAARVAAGARRSVATDHAAPRSSVNAARGSSSSATSVAEGGTAVHGVVVDLAAVTFMDSAGLGALVGAYQRAEADGTHLRIAGASGSVREVFAVTGLSTVFDLQPSVAEAVTATA